MGGLKFRVPRRPEFYSASVSFLVSSDWSKNNFRGPEILDRPSSRILGGPKRYEILVRPSSLALGVPRGSDSK